MTTTGYGYLRATDADRDRALGVLQAAYADGRLTWEEFDTRSTALVRARTYDQIFALTADLLRPVPYQSAYPALPGNQPGTNGLAVVSLSFGLGQIMLPFLGGIVAIATGHASRSQIRRTGQDGAGMALTGLTLGYLGVLLPVLVILATIYAAFR